jgi:NAD+ synthase (glutamine-hydrolysing)
MRIALCQINPTVGDLEGNARRILEAARRAADAGADLAVCPELCIVGYPPMDLLDRPQFIEDSAAAVGYIAGAAPAGMGLIIGAPVRNDSSVGKRLHNAALVIDGGRVVETIAKTLLPTYDVFDEYRHFEPASERRLVHFRGVRLGLHVCEDVWNNEESPPYHLYGPNPVDELAAKGAELFININASPFAVGKAAARTSVLAATCREHRLPFVYVNQVGANTELIFDGDSRVHDASGRIVARAGTFVEDILIWDTEAGAGPLADESSAPSALVHDALVLGIRDYVDKTGAFTKALVGLSGGIDSAVTCALAAEALGPDRIVGVTMPSEYSSAGSITDSAALAENLGIEFSEISIRPAVDAFESMLAEAFAGRQPDVTEENIQARARGVTLMALSNKFGYLLLTTGNKSEMAVGYATLYGDMNGGLAVLADVFKTEVYQLAHEINARASREIIPQATITKAPSAELRPGQTDQDTLPPYDVLDRILEAYVENHLDTRAVVDATGLDIALVERVARMVDRAEFKRRQAAPGLRVSRKAFGMGRRLPIAMRRTRVTTAPAVDGAGTLAGLPHST